MAHEQAGWLCWGESIFVADSAPFVKAVKTCVWPDSAHLVEAVDAWHGFRGYPTDADQYNFNEAWKTFRRENNLICRTKWWQVSEQAIFAELKSKAISKKTENKQEWLKLKASYSNFKN